MTSRLGLSPSYKTVHKGHFILAESQMTRARAAACHADGHSTGWDNTQISTSVHVEQWGLAPPKVETGTTSIIYPLHNSLPEAIKLKPNLERQKNCDMIQFSDIRPTSLQLCAINCGLILEVIKILLNNETGFDYINKSDS